MIEEDEPALYVDGLSKTFGNGENAVTAVEDISLVVDSGEVIGLLGPNGAGKTTTIKLVLGLTLPDQGEVRIQGVNVYDRPRQAYKLGTFGPNLVHRCIDEFLFIQV